MCAFEASEPACNNFFELGLEHHERRLIELPSVPQRVFALACVPTGMTSKRGYLAGFFGERTVVLVTPSVEMQSHSLFFIVYVDDLGEAPVVDLIACVYVLV
jgi:hypothetical protein